MISVDTSGQLLQASALHRIALFKMPNTSSSAAWRLELVNDNHGRKEHQQQRIERRREFQYWLTDWVDTSKKNWQAACGMFETNPKMGVYFKLDFFEWASPSQFQGKALAFDYQLLGVEFPTYTQKSMNANNETKKTSWFLPIPASFIYGNHKAKRFSDLLNPDAYFTERGTIQQEALEAMYKEAIEDTLDPLLLRLYLLSTIEMLANSSSLQLPAVSPEIINNFK